MTNMDLKFSPTLQMDGYTTLSWGRSTDTLPISLTQDKRCERTIDIPVLNAQQLVLLNAIVASIGKLIYSLHKTMVYRKESASPDPFL